jgi:hypothetical protein
LQLRSFRLGRSPVSGLSRTRFSDVERSGRTLCLGVTLISNLADACVRPCISPAVSFQSSHWLIDACHARRANGRCRNATSGHADNSDDGKSTTPTARRPRSPVRFAQTFQLTVDHEVGGSSPPSCTTQRAESDTLFIIACFTLPFQYPSRNHRGTTRKQFVLLKPFEVGFRFQRMLQRSADDRAPATVLVAGRS